MFDISKLKNGIVNSLDIDESINFTEEDLKDTEIRRLENVKVKGKISRIENDIYHISINITGNMVLECARSLEDVDYKLDISVDKNIGEEASDEEKPLILQNTLDIFAIVWENIVLEVPLRVVKEDATYLKEGNGWSLEEDSKEKTNSPFSELKSMLDMEGKE